MDAYRVIKVTAWTTDYPELGAKAGQRRTAAIRHGLTKRQAMDLAERLAGAGAEFFSTGGADVAKVIGYEGAGGRYEVA